MEEKAAAEQPVVDEETFTLFVKNLNFATTDQDLEKVSVVVVDRISNRSFFPISISHPSDLVVPTWRKRKIPNIQVNCYPWVMVLLSTRRRDYSTKL